MRTFTPHSCESLYLLYEGISDKSPSLDQRKQDCDNKGHDIALPQTVLLTLVSGPTACTAQEYRARWDGCPEQQRCQIITFFESFEDSTVLIQNFPQEYRAKDVCGIQDSKSTKQVKCRQEIQSRYVLLAGNEEVQLRCPIYQQFALCKLIAMHSQVM